MVVSDTQQPADFFSSQRVSASFTRHVVKNVVTEKHSHVDKKKKKSRGCWFLSSHSGSRYHWSFLTTTYITTSPEMTSDLGTRKGDGRNGSRQLDKQENKAQPDQCNSVWISWAEFLSLGCPGLDPPLIWTKSCHTPRQF